MTQLPFENIKKYVLKKHVLNKTEEKIGMRIAIYKDKKEKGVEDHE